MKPPSPTRVGPYRYAVERTNMDDNDAVGTCLTEQELIRVHDGLSFIKERETILHEHFHAVWAERGILPGADDRTEELVIGPLATGALQLLRDNPRLVRYLTEEP